jgi:hypothetical protein
MTLEPGWVEAIASVVTALIILGTAVAAFAQLRHGRNANDIVVYLRLVDFMDAPSTYAAREKMATLADRLAADPEYAVKLRDRSFAPEDTRGIGDVIRFLEHLSTLIYKGGVAERLVLAEYADTIVEMWEALRPWVAERRQAFGPYTGSAFEHLAMRAKHYIEGGQMDRDYASLERDPRSPYQKPRTGGPNHA